MGAIGVAGWNEARETRSDEAEGAFIVQLIKGGG